MDVWGKSKGNFKQVSKNIKKSIKEGERIMQFKDKQNLVIRLNNSTGEYDFEYNPDIIFNGEKYNEQELINELTKERFLYKELVLGMDDKNRVYFYPPELYGSNKTLKDYRIEHWLFLDDRRYSTILNSGFQHDVITWMKSATETINKFGQIINEAGSVINVSTEALNNAMAIVNGSNNNIQTGQFPQPAGAAIIKQPTTTTSSGTAVRK